MALKKPEVVDLGSKFTITDDVVTEEQWVKRRGPYPPLQLPDPERGFLVRPIHPDRLPGPVQAKIIQWKYEHVVPEHIEERIKYMGYVVPAEIIDEWANKACRDGGEISDSLELDDLRLRMEQKIVYSLLDIIFNATNKMNEIQVRDVYEFEKLATAAAKLVNAIAQRERVELDKATTVHRVRDWLKKEFQRLMAGRPELVDQINQITQQVNAVIDQSAENVKKINLEQ